MGAFLDLSGQRFGHLTVLSRFGEARPTKWQCVCDCGERRVVMGPDLKKGSTRSCGCSTAALCLETKGQDRRSKSAEYAIWAGILSRCRNPNRKGFALYGARGIDVCERWLSFSSFLADMGPRPSPKHSVERCDNNRGYEPENCIWGTPNVQANNRRNTRRVVYRGQDMALTDAIRQAGSVVHREAAWVRIRDCGWTVERAVETPATKESPNSKRRKALKQARSRSEWQPRLTLGRAA